MEKQKKREHDFAITAFRVVQESTKDEETRLAESHQRKQAQEERHAAAVMLGRLGGKKGGPVRAAKLTPEQRKDIARKAARARWGKGA